MPDNHVPMAVVRRLALVSARITSGGDLASTLQAVADGVVDVVGFGIAVVNLRRSSGDFAVVAIAGPDELKAVLTGAVCPRDDMDRTLTMSDQWGSLRFNPQDRFDEAGAAQWVPSTPVIDELDTWLPQDMLFAPMWTDSGELIAVLSVDQPPGGKRSSQQVCELLEIFAAQAGIAIAAVEGRELSTAERTSREHLLIDQAHRDALTGLANRRALDARLVLSTNIAAHGDRNGHPRGDDVLRSCAKAITAHVRDGDLVSRAGGDEFVVIADAITREAADRLAQRLRDILIPTGESDSLGVTLSVGVAVIDGRADASWLLAQADAAMYRDKASRQ